MESSALIQREEAAVVVYDETNRRDRTSNNQKIMKSLYLSSGNLFRQNGFYYLPLQQALYAAGYRISAKVAKTADKRIKVMEADFAAILSYEVNRDQTNLNAFMQFSEKVLALKAGNPTKRKLIKAGWTVVVLSSYLHTSNVGASTRSREVFQKSLFGSAIKQEVQNNSWLELQNFGLGEISSSGKDYSKDASGKSISIFKLYSKVEEYTGDLTLSSLFASLAISFSTHTEELLTDPQTLVEEYRLYLDLSYEAYREFSLYNTIRKGEEDYKRAVWTEEHPEFHLAKKAEADAAKAKKEEEKAKASKITSYRKAQLSKGYAVINPDGEYVRPKLDAFMKNEIDNGYRKLNEYGTVVETGKRQEEINESMSNNVTSEPWMNALLEDTVEAPESDSEPLLINSDAETRLSLKDLQRIAEEPKFTASDDYETHMNNLRKYAAAKLAYTMDHITDGIDI